MKREELFHLAALFIYILELSILDRLPLIMRRNISISTRQGNCSPPHHQMLRLELGPGKNPPLQISAQHLGLFFANKTLHLIHLL